MNTENITEYAKMLLDEVDGSKDAVIKFLAEDVAGAILAYCRIEIFPEQLTGLAAMITADLYRERYLGEGSVKSVSEGDRSVSYDTVTAGSIIGDYEARLLPFVNRKGRVPSDIQS